jgi:hypothetical protein
MNNENLNLISDNSEYIYNELNEKMKEITQKYKENNNHLLLRVYLEPALIHFFINALYNLYPCDEKRLEAIKRLYSIVEEEIKNKSEENAT